MAITVDWLNEGNIISLTFTDEITIDELAIATNQAVALIDSVATPLVHSIIDGTQVTKYPHNILQLREASKLSFNHPRYGWLMIYGAPDGLSSFFVNMVTSFFRVRVRMVDTLDEAIDFLKSVDINVAEDLE